MLGEGDYGIWMSQDPPCPGGFLYTIRAGDTLYNLAIRFGTTVGAIIAANPGINPNALRVGQRICIRRGVAGPVGACPPGSITYVIRAGDTFYAIAQRYGIPLDRLIRANPRVNPNALVVGQTICVPTVSARPLPPPRPFSCSMNLQNAVGAVAPNATGRMWISVDAFGNAEITVAGENLPAPTQLGGTSYSAAITVDRRRFWIALTETIPGRWVGSGTNPAPAGLTLRGRVDVYPGPVLIGMLSGCR